MVKFRRTARYPSVIALPGHSMAADWAYPGLDVSYLNFAKMLRWMPKREPQSISFDAICAKPGNWAGVNDFEGPRYDAADVGYPGIVIEAMVNPCKLRWRLVDGRRRMEKQRRAGATSGLFLVYSVAEAEQFIVEAILPR